MNLNNLIIENFWKVGNKIGILKEDVNKIFNISLKRSSGYQDDLTFTFIDKKLNQIQVSELDPIEVNIEKDNYNRVHISGIADSLQNNGYGKLIYQTLIDMYGFISTSETSNSIDVRRVWGSLIKSGNYYHATIGPFTIVSNDDEIIEYFLESKRNLGWSEDDEY